MPKRAVVSQVAPAGNAEPCVFNLERAAKYLGLSKWTLRQLVYAGMLPVVTLPSPRSGTGQKLRRILIAKVDLDALIQSGRGAAA